LDGDPNEMRRVTYPLTSDSLIVDVGGWTGEWAKRMYCLYSCNIDIYEPEPHNAELANLKFRGNPKVSIYQVAMSNQKGKMLLNGVGQGASLCENKLGDSIEVDVVKASDVFNERYPDKIDLLKINVEGAEYDIIPDLIENWGIEKATHIQIQFHKTAPNYESRRKDIEKKLLKTHRKIWGYDWIFDSYEVIR
jgi:FkbM family methyltransferase